MVALHGTGVNVHMTRQFLIEVPFIFNETAFVCAT